MMAAQSSVRSHALELLVAYYQNPSTALRNKIVRLNVGLVRKIAHRVSHQSTESYEDLEQIGYLGLIRAIERFNPNHGCAFSSFAVPYIRGEMLHFLRDRAGSVKVPRRWQQLNAQSHKVQAALVEELGRQPSDVEIAQALGVSLNEWRESKLANKNRQLLSLDAVVSQQTDTVTTLGDTLVNPRDQVLQSLEDDRQQLQEALNQLEEKTRTVIECVYYRNLSRKETAEQLGVSPMTVTRRIHQGLQQMMTSLHSPQFQPE